MAINDEEKKMKVGLRRFSKIAPDVTGERVFVVTPGFRCASLQEGEVSPLFQAFSRTSCTSTCGCVETQRNSPIYNSRY